MITLHKMKSDHGVLALICLAIFGAVLFWIAVFCIATLIVFTSGDAATAQIPEHTCEQFVESGDPGAAEAAPGWAKPFGGTDMLSCA